MSVAKATLLHGGVVLVEPAVVGQCPACSARKSIRQLDEHIALRHAVCTAFEHYAHGMNALRKILHVQEDMSVSERTALLRGVVLIEPAVVGQNPACSAHQSIRQLDEHIALRHAVCTTFEHYAHGVNALRKVLHVQEDMSVSERTALLSGIVFIEPAVISQCPACLAR